MLGCAEDERRNGMNKQWKGPSGRRFCCGKNSIFSRRRSVWLAVSSQKDRATFSPPTKSGKEKIAGACEMKSLGREGSILRPYAHFKRLVAYTTVICVQNAASDTQWQIGKARQSVGNVERTFAPMTPPESRSWSEGHKAGEIAGTSKRGNKIDLKKNSIAYCPLLREALTPEEISPFARTVLHSGHFHRRKLHLSGKNSLRYIGAPSLSHVTSGPSSGLPQFPLAS